MFLAATASSIETYGGEGGKVAAETAQNASALPMTGIELALIFLGGLILLGVGILIAKLN